MTLANFNSNFNWQLRMLKEAADCCGIVPVVPPPPPLQDCLFYYAPDIDITLWTIEGEVYDNIGAINAALAPYGYTYFYYFNADEVENRFCLNYVGTTPPTYLPTILDGNGDPVTWYFTSCCTKVCLTGIFNANEYYYFQTGYGWTAAFGALISAFDAPDMQTFMQGLYGPQISYFAEDNRDGTFTVNIDNAYICSPVAWSANDLDYIPMVSCGVVPACEEMYIVSFTDPTTSSFTGWTLNGYPDYDWGSLAASFGGTYILDFSSVSPPFSPPSLATFMYQGPTPPPALLGTDAFGNPVSYSFVRYCQRRVLQMVTDGLPSPTISYITIAGITLDLLAYGGPTSLYDPTAANIITTALQVYFGPSAYCLTHLTDGYTSSPFTIDLFNVYADNAPSFTYVGPFAMQVIWYSYQFDFTSVTPLSFANIAADLTLPTPEYTYALQTINWVVPADFYINLQFSCIYDYYYATDNTSPTTVFSNGQVSTTEPLSNGMLLQTANNTIRIFNNFFILLGSCQLCDVVSYTDTINVRCPYTGYATIGTLENNVKL